MRNETQRLHSLEIDATGLLCPLPVLKLRKRMAETNSGEVIKLITDDPAAAIDVPHFCAENKHELLFIENVKDNLNKNRQAFFVRKR